MILITGASGNVGREVLRQIAQTVSKVRATFQSASSAASAPSGVEIAIMDYNKPETICAALKGVERVFLVGPPTQTLPALERKAMDEISRSGVRLFQSEIARKSNITGISRTIVSWKICAPMPSLQSALDLYSGSPLSIWCACET